MLIVFPSEMTEEMLARRATSQGSDVARFDKTFIPQERAGQAEDMGGTLLYLASKAGAYISGCSVGKSMVSSDD